MLLLFFAQLKVIIMISDCKSLFDAVQQMTPSLTEKRTIIDVQAIKQALQTGSFRWVPTDMQHADGLTKNDPRLRETLAQLMMNMSVTLRDTKTADVYT